MQRRLNTTLFFTLSFSFLFTSILVAQSKQPPAQRWEYKTAYNVSESDLDKLGDEGWELVASAFNPGPNSLYYTLKRLKPADAPKYVEPAKRPAPPAHIPACNLSLTQSPTIRGLRLSMTLDELIELFPGANPNEIRGKVEQAKGVPNLGYSHFNFSGTQHKDRLEGYSFSVNLFDNKVTSFGVNYPFMNQENGIGRIFTGEQFRERLIESFKLPAKEYWEEDSSNINLRCREFYVNGSFDYNLRVYLTDISNASEEISKQRRNDALAKKRAEFKP